MERTTALNTISDRLAAYRAYQNAARGTFGPVREAWQHKIENARQALRFAIYLFRENDFEGNWA